MACGLVGGCGGEYDEVEVGTVENRTESLRSFLDSAKVARSERNESLKLCRLRSPGVGEETVFRMSGEWLRTMMDDLRMGDKPFVSDDDELDCSAALDIVQMHRKNRIKSLEEGEAHAAAQSEQPSQVSESPWIVGSSKSTVTSVVGIDIPDGNQGLFTRCTATLIGRGVLATAAHCFDDANFGHGDVFKINVHYMDGVKKKSIIEKCAYFVEKDYGGLGGYEDDFALVHVFGSKWLDNKSNKSSLYVGVLRSTRSK